MKKADRELIRLKYNGRCAYCGCELNSKFHVDEILPCVRKRKYIPAHWDDKSKPICTEDDDYKNPKFRKWIEGRWVSDGYEYPERVHVSNQNPACASCNINKHSMSLEQFRESITNFVNSLNQYSVQYKIAKRYGLIEETKKPVLFYFETLNNK